MHKFNIYIISLALLVFITACGSNAAYDSNFDSAYSEKSAQLSRQIIRSASLEIEVPEPTITVSSIKQLVSRESGYISNIYDKNQRQFSIRIMVPAHSLDSFIEEVTSMGTIISKSLRTRDVTEEVIDVKAKLTNLKALRTKFRALLNKAKNVSELLKIESELSRIQTQIDSIEARQKSLKSQITLSNVNITITQETIYGPLGYLGKGIVWVFEKLFVIQ